MAAGRDRRTLSPSSVLCGAQVRRGNWSTAGDRDRNRNVHARAKVRRGSWSTNPPRKGKRESPGRPKAPLHAARLLTAVTTSLEPRPRPRDRVPGQGRGGGATPARRGGAEGRPPESSPGSRDPRPRYTRTRQPRDERLSARETRGKHTRPAPGPGGAGGAYACACACTRESRAPWAARGAPPPHAAAPTPRQAPASGGRREGRGGGGEGTKRDTRDDSHAAAAAAKPPRAPRSGKRHRTGPDRTGSTNPCVEG